MVQNFEKCLYPLLVSFVPLCRPSFWQMLHDTSFHLSQSCVPLLSAPLVLSLFRRLMDRLHQSWALLVLRTLVEPLEQQSRIDTSKLLCVTCAKQTSHFYPGHTLSFFIVILSLQAEVEIGATILVSVHMSFDHWDLRTSIGVIYVASKKAWSSCTKGAM